MYQLVLVLLAVLTGGYAVVGLMPTESSVALSFDDLQKQLPVSEKYIILKRGLVSADNALELRLRSGRAVVAPMISIGERFEEIDMAADLKPHFFLLKQQLPEVCVLQTKFCLKSYPRDYEGKFIASEDVPDEIADQIFDKYALSPLWVNLVIEEKQQSHPAYVLFSLLVSLLALAALLWHWYQRKSRKPGKLLSATDYHDILRHAMLLMAAADGRTEETEVTLVQAIYKKVTGITLDKFSIRQELVQVQNSQEDLCVYLDSVNQHLSPTCKEEIVTSVIMVMAADGDLVDEERALLRKVSNALGVLDIHASHLFHEVLSKSQSE